MGDVRGFLKYDRQTQDTLSAEDRLENYKEFYKPVSVANTTKQGSRCMDCGVPFCHNGCPLGNIIPDFNDAVHREEWKEAYTILSMTNNFPEFTGRICPAPCEKACVLGINSDPVSIEFIEKSIIERAYKEGWVEPNVPTLNGKKVAVVGSGPAGLAAADQLNKAGYAVTVFERNDEPGGLLRYGIPDFKLAKSVIKRRVDVMKASGIEFKVNAWIGRDISAKDIEADYDAIVMCGGSTIPRDINIEGRESEGVRFAMDFLEESNRFVAGGTKGVPKINVRGKDVIVIGGGDTGADCVGTSNRQGAASVTQLELLTKPGDVRTDRDPWPMWPMTLRTSTSHDEGCLRKWSVNSKEFLTDDKGNLIGLQIVDVEWGMDPATGRYTFMEIQGSERVLKADAIFLAIGFLYPDPEGMLAQLNIKLDGRGNVSANNYQTSNEKVFAAGDMRRGQSLVVWAISEGREAARAVDTYLSGENSTLEAKEESLMAI